MGGFGNILFQILAYRVIQKHNFSVQYVDILTKRNIFTKLFRWTIHERLYNDFIDNKKINNKNIVKSCFIIINALISKKFGIKKEIATFYTNKMKFEPPFSKNNFGYFQNKEFLSQNKNELLNLGRDIRDKYRTNSSNIVVHYRAGDSHWAVEHKEYYRRVKELIKKERDIVLIATDSPKDALNFFYNCSNIKLTDAKNAMDDFKYMINAKKLYCAPSTFSWWAAHVGEKQEVVIPQFLVNKLGIYISENKVKAI
jgi:hypothetical protein